MRRLPPALLLALAPALAVGQIKNTRHDLSATSTAAVRAMSETQICIFCHVPHHSSQTRLLWNKPAVSGTRGWTAGSTTTAGTPLPTDVAPESKRCLSCHDGSIALGNVVSAGDPNPFSMTSDYPGSADLVGSGGAMDGNHPVSIPYAGKSYNGAVSGVTGSALTKYWLASTSGCVSPSGICTAQTPDGKYINLRAGPNPGDVGVECTTCHEIHNKYSANPYFLRVTDANSQLCMACHNN